MKNDGSKRIIAAHNIVYPCFQKQGEGRLFNYRMMKMESANAASKALMKLIRQVKRGTLIVVHSLLKLHRFYEKSTNPLEAHKFMAGHSLGDVSGEYGIGPVAALYEFTIEPPMVSESRNAHYDDL